MRHARRRHLDRPRVAATPAAADALERPDGAAAAAATPPALWLALHLPLLPLEAWRATLPTELTQGAQGRPLVLVTEHRVSHLDTRAATRGIRPGMKRATALALAADLLIGQADPARDAAALQAVAHAALAFTPGVALEGEATVLLEVHAVLRLFGGLPALLQRLRAALAPLGHRLQVAAAPTAFGAALLARWAPADRGDLVLGPQATRREALAALLDAAPVWQVGPAREHWEALQGMGLHTLSDLRALPRAGLARRFGEGLLDDIDRAYGLRADPQRWLELPEHFESRLELFARAETTEQVLAGAGVLLARLVAWAQGRHGRVGAFTLVMRHEPRHGAPVAATELRIELAEPALDPAHLQLLLRERLAGVTLAAPTLELALRCRHLVAGAAPNGELFPTRQSAQEGLLRLLERLRARLGDERVQRLQPVADHRPELASRLGPAMPPTASSTASARVPPPLGDRGVVDALTRPLQRPALLLDEPLPLATRGALPLLDGHELQLVSGPERIECGWWDGDLVARDYFIGLAADGSLVWLWRHRMPAPAGAVQWFLQGRFA
jgi:protein ImuB